MEADRLVDREAFPEIPPRVLYSLTPMGISLIEALKPLCAWGTRHIASISDRHLRECAEPAAGRSAQQSAGNEILD
jgi:DNA-binding HxlR family transcriptional regulator